MYRVSFRNSCIRQPLSRRIKAPVACKAYIKYEDLKNKLKIAIDEANLVCESTDDIKECVIKWDEVNDITKALEAEIEKANQNKKQSDNSWDVLMD